MEKHTYVVAEGIPAINGKAVPASREIELTEREALFDQSLGRITLKPSRVSARKPRPEPEQSSDDMNVEG
tara:strand:+ start:23356 stop:23565 length:210 start_codon:yes stop_codon:yes gene_type:complete